jgi:Ferredoxin-like domain in Api92-like protein
MANEVQNHLTVVPLPETEGLAKALELEMYGSAVPHESGNLFVEVVDAAFEYVTKWEPKINALIELSKKYKDCTFLLSYGCWEIQRNGQVVIRNGDVLASLDRSGGYGLFDDLLHPAIDLLTPYIRERTLAQCAADYLQHAIGIVRGLLGIMDDERFKHSPSTTFSEVRNQKQTQKVRADLAALLESMATQIGQINFTGVLLEESELREGLIRNAKLAEGPIANGASDGKGEK